MSAIDAYITDLDGALRGQGRAKADMLAEARDGLVDAAEAYEAAGADRAAAERRAVEDFGALDEIARGYQAELGLSLGRRTTLLLTGVLFGQHFAWDYAFPWLMRSAVDDPLSLASHGLEIAAMVLALVGSVATVVALLLSMACGLRIPLLRAAAVQQRLPRGIGVFALMVAAFYTVVSLPVAVLYTDGTVLRVHLAWTVVVLVAPMLCVAASARRTLAAA